MSKTTAARLRRLESVHGRADEYASWSGADLLWRMSAIVEACPELAADVADLDEEEAALCAFATRPDIAAAVADNVATGVVPIPDLLADVRWPYLTRRAVLEASHG